ncbi:hypothetical protein DY000_02021449 [Brassica cretica]|uniref:Uncharacterized protein n=1 Tax=Brassica cretica TaxID=69181 RepID=A0ABQ7E6K9_BRACR|nr:hypothetical protein DY000_02021449 [Brassica cretica]
MCITSSVPPHAYLLSKPTSSGSTLYLLDEAIQVEVPIVRRGPTTRSGTRALREGFTKAVQLILDRDGQTDQEQLLIEEMFQLKIQDQAGPAEVQDATGLIQFRLNQAERTRSATPLSIATAQPSLAICPICPVRVLGPLLTIPSIEFERNARIHRQTLRYLSSLIKVMDCTIRNRILSLMEA